jgi:hypothetical protein
MVGTLPFHQNRDNPQEQPPIVDCRLEEITPLLLEDLPIRQGGDEGRDFPFSSAFSVENQGKIGHGIS